MAGKSDGTVYIDTRVDTKGFGKGVNTMEKQVSGLTGAIGKLGLAIAATFAVGKLISFGKEAVELGSDLQEVQNVVDVTFTTMSDKVDEFAKSAAEAAGLSETMAKKYLGTFGAMSKAFGFMEDEAFAMSSTLTQAVGDVASFYNLTQDEAYTKLKSVFTGETESLKDLGVVMTQSALDSYAMAKGYGKTTKAMSEQEKVALRYSFVLDQLSASSGDFQRTSDGWANQMRILNLNFDSFKANIGQALINIFTPFLKVINQIVAKMAEFSAHFVAFSELLVGKQTSGGGGSPGEALAEISSGYEDITDATKEATKAQNNYLTGLDEIRTFAKSSNQTVEATSGILGANTLDVNTGGNIDTRAFDTMGALVDQVREKVEALTEKFPILGHAINYVKNLFALVKNVASDLFNLLTKPITDNKEGFIEATKNALSFIETILGRIIEGMSTFMEQLNRVYEETIRPVIEKITEDISALVEKFLIWFNEDMAPVLDRWGEKFDVLWTEHIDPLLANLAEFFGEVAEGFGYLWDEIIEPFVDWFIEIALPLLTPAIETIGDTFMRTVGVVADVISEFIDILDGLIDFTLSTFTGDWKLAWEGIREIFAGIINSMTTILEDFINSGVLGMLRETVNSFNTISKKAGFKITLPSIPNISIPKIKIPKLATGAVIPPNAPFMAMLGDQRHGTNIEAPLDTIKQAVREVMGSGGGTYHFVAQLDGEVLFEKFVSQAQLNQMATGQNVLANL